MIQHEKREYIRVPLSLPINGKCTETIFKNHIFQGEIRNIGYEGIGIVLDRHNGFQVGQKMTFRTQLYSGDFKIKGKGVICWFDQKALPDRPINLGVKLTKVSHYGKWCEKIEKNIPQTVKES